MDKLKQHLKFAAYESFFVFYDNYYCQIDGVTMRFPSGPAFAKACL